MQGLTNYTGKVMCRALNLVRRGKTITTKRLYDVSRAGSPAAEPSPAQIYSGDNELAKGSSVRYPDDCSRR